MQLSKLISEGEQIEMNTKKEFYNTKALDEQGDRWISRSILYLKKNYSDSVLTKNFISESEKADKDYHNMVAILKGLKDVEEELGLLNE